MSRKIYEYNPIVFVTTDLTNGMIYVGQHYTSAEDGYLGSGRYFKTVVKAKGRKNFVRKLIEHCTTENLNDREIFWISELHATDPNIGYNRSFGGQTAPMLGLHPSEETLLKMSEAHMGEKNHNFGKPMSVRSKQKNRESQLGEKSFWFGKTRSTESKRKNSKSHMGEKNHMFGKHPSEETLLKMSEAHMGEKNPVNKYHFYCSDNKDYWTDFTKMERNGICGKFRRKNSDTIVYKGTTITRVLKK